MDQTESNNSRGITTLAHGNRSYPGEMASVRRGKDGKRVVWGGRGEGGLERGGSLMKEVEVAFFSFTRNNENDDILLSSTRMYRTARTAFVSADITE